MAEDKNRPVDLIMVSLQEVDMSASAMLKEETEASTPWVVGLHAAVGAILGHQATPHIMPFHPSNLLASYMCLPTTPTSSLHAGDVCCDCATGALGSMGNKGAIGLRLVLHRTSLCLINVHLAAGQSNW
ncbi:hypothetical protein TcBrA4_0119070 [Trypanosoma cruzi]|nr:hypothetical protein TcBrA4_0119070 [Trypanosoma cruzi]